ncbi:hypothetical protein DVA76_18695, partial [Acinetobacter baumannii]
VDCKKSSDGSGRLGKLNVRPTYNSDIKSNPIIRSTDFHNLFPLPHIIILKNILFDPFKKPSN